MRQVSMLFIFVLLMAAGCAKRERVCCPCKPGDQLDEGLMLLLNTARSLHHQADLQLSRGEAGEAEASVRKILALDLNSRWIEAEEARLDARARLAKLLLERGAVDKALKEVDDELGRTARESFYLSNLHSVRGEALEAQGKKLEGEGKKKEARELARQAIAAFETSIGINKRLQAKLSAGKEQSKSAGKEQSK